MSFMAKDPRGCLAVRLNSRKGLAMNFFKTLLHPDREELENGERVLIARAANILQVGEFQLLQLAYREWFGHDLPEAKVSQLFTSYMLHDAVPHWARHYARQIIELDDQGRLDDADPDWHRYDSDYQTAVPHGRRQFAVAVAAIVILVGGGILLAELSVGPSQSRLPPYFDKKELSVPAERRSG